jgi:DNA-binding Lrp family transcriptional regulator
MVNAVILLKVEPARLSDILDTVAAMDNVSEVYSVGGRYDVVVIIRAPSNEAMAETVTGELLQTPGIRDSETLIAFKAVSRHDLERLFSVGLD